MLDIVKMFLLLVLQIIYLYSSPWLLFQWTVSPPIALITGFVTSWECASVTRATGGQTVPSQTQITPGASEIVQATVCLTWMLRNVFAVSIGLVIIVT